MPRKTKENNELKDEIKKEKKATTATKKTSTKSDSKKNTTKKVSTAKTNAKKTTSKKASSAKVDAKKTTAKKVSSAKVDAKKTTAKKVSSAKANTKKTTSKKDASAKVDAKKTTAKKASSAKADTKKATSKKVSTTKADTKKTTTKKRTTTKVAKTKKVETVEYYDLPYRYNQTIIKTLAQTPTTLFIYWDISDKDRENYENQYGKNFFEITKPVLIVYNDTLGYNFEIEINDFANSWYLHVADSKCNYRIELGRRPIQKNEDINVDYIYITSSNKIESPNDKILFNPNQKMIYFRNVKTNVVTSKSINTLSFIQNMGKFYDIYDFYKAIYQNENIEEIYNNSNPSSSPSSQFK